MDFEKKFIFVTAGDRSEEKQINFCIKRMQSILMRRATTRLPQLATAARVPQLATVTRLPPLSLRSRTQSTQAAAAGQSTLDTPFISDTIPLAEGVLGTVEEMLAEPGQAVEENEVVAVVETDKVSLDIRASRGGVILAALVQVGDEVKEKQPIYTLED